MLHRLAVLTITLLLATGTGTALAQGTATLSGEVKDTYGSVIPAADIIATNNATGAEVTDSTDAVGNYRLTLEPGTYTVTVEA
ncbi:MAG: carboxypeptidase-like regulatory domain-containing protein, partial [Acidobacteria bacterium]|nr:carboxypeptidase-like regulatory domain-containing protein [Acidobacteriota bacterium]